MSLRVTKPNQVEIPDRTIGRLSLYRRLLADLLEDGIPNIYSHQLANISGVTAAQVRRDMMTIGYSGTSRLGYDVKELIDSISDLLDAQRLENVVLVGVGNLGRAIISYFSGRRPNLSVTAAFDIDPDKTGRVSLGCRVYPLQELAQIVKETDIKVAIITVPEAKAQEVADVLVQAGVKGILNFAPTRLRTPGDVYVENMDVTMSLERVAYFARQRESRRTRRL